MRRLKQRAARWRRDSISRPIVLMRWSTARPETSVVRDGLPATLRLYRWLMTAAAPLLPLLLSYRLKRGKEDPARLGERRGETGIARPAGTLIWLHGASV